MFKTLFVFILLAMISLNWQYVKAEDIEEIVNESEYNTRYWYNDKGKICPQVCSKIKLDWTGKTSGDGNPWFVYTCICKGPVTISGTLEKPGKCNQGSTWCGCKSERSSYPLRWRCWYSVNKDGPWREYLWSNRTSLAECLNNCATFNNATLNNTRTKH